jgi:hypothetical protein
MDRVTVESKTLRSVGYEDGTLEIEFVSGSVYRYFDVASRVHEDLMRADSHRRFFNKEIRGTYLYARL